MIVQMDNSRILDYTIFPSVNVQTDYLTICADLHRE